MVIIVNNLWVMNSTVVYRYKQAQHKASEDDMRDVDELLALIAPGAADTDDEQSVAPTQAYARVAATQVPRVLKREISDVSLDEDGLPKCLQIETDRTPSKPAVAVKAESIV